MEPEKQHSFWVGLYLFWLDFFQGGNGITVSPSSPLDLILCAPNAHEKAFGKMALFLLGQYLSAKMCKLSGCHRTVLQSLGSVAASGQLHAP